MSQSRDISVLYLAIKRLLIDDCSELRFIALDA